MSNISNSSNTFRKLNLTENSSNLIERAPPNLGDTSYPIYNARKRDAGADYVSRVKITLKSCVSDINFADPVDTRKICEDLMTQARNKAICISNQHIAQI